MACSKMMRKTQVW